MALNLNLSPAEKKKESFSSHCKKHGGWGPASVYAIGVSGHPSFVKIGIAVVPEQRVLQLQPGSPFRLTLLATREVCCKDYALQCEKTLHQQLKEFRRASEWFELSTEHLDEVRELFLHGAWEAE